MTTAKPDPVVKAFLVCDCVIHDAQTGKKSLVGVFHELRSDRFPAVHPVLWIYANITNARGKYKFEIRLVDIEEGKMLGKGRPPEISIPGPLQTTELSAQLRNVTLPRPGTYEFHLLSDESLIATKAIRVSQTQRPTPPEEGGAEPPAQL